MTKFVSWKGVSFDVAPLPFTLIADGDEAGAGVGSISPASTGPAVEDFPDLLFGDASTPDRIFSSDDAAENHMRRMYHDPDPANDAFRDAVDTILAGNPIPELAVPETPVATPGPTGGAAVGLLGFSWPGHRPATNSYAAAADSLFAGATGASCVRSRGRASRAMRTTSSSSVTRTKI